MKFLADENFPLSSYQFLKDKGWNIEHIGLTNSSISDYDVMQLSIKQKRIIITFDSDYGELVFKKGYLPLGVIYLRMQNFTPSYPGEFLYDLIENSELVFISYFTVIEKNQIRQRRI